MTYYRRRLPHWHPTGQPLFLTWRLKGSLPRHRHFPGYTLTLGQAFWQEDHWVRDGKELARIMAYIEDNPVRAGLVATPEAYPWSSANSRGAGLATGCGSGEPPHTWHQQLGKM
jgi:hypothetical protein